MPSTVLIPPHLPTSLPQDGGRIQPIQPIPVSCRQNKPKSVRVIEKRRRSTGDWSSMLHHQLNTKPPTNASDPRHSFRYAATPRASLGFHEHDSRRVFDDDFLEELRQQRARSTNSQASTRRPSLSGLKQFQTQQTTRFSFARSLKHFRRRLYWQLAALKSPMSPEGLARRIQEFVLTGVLGFELFYIPFALSYLSDPEESAGCLRTGMLINIAVEILLVTDIALNFNTAVYDKPSKHSRLITSRQQIIRRYLSGWFAADLLGSLPVECISYIVEENGDPRPLLELNPAIYIICHVLRFLRLPQLFRSSESNVTWMCATMPAVKVKSGAYQPVFCTTVKLGAGVVVVAHYVACLSRGLQLADNYHLIAQPSSLSALYTTNLRLVVVGMFGSGNEGVNDSFCIFLVLVGLLIMAFVVSSMAVVAMDLQFTSDKKYTQNSRVLTSRMDKLKLPPDLQDRVQKFYDHVWNEYDSLDGDILEFTSRLPRPLALEVLLHRYLDLVSGLEFWADCSQDFLSTLVLSIDVRIFAPDDDIVRENDIGSELFMIHRGFVEQTGAENLAQRLTRGGAFGEVALLLNYHRDTCVRAVTFVESCALSRHSFYKILSRYPGIRRRVVVALLTAGFRSKEHPELWRHAKQLAAIDTNQSDGSFLDAALFETQLSCSDAAEMLVDLMQLDKGPWESIELLPRNPDGSHLCSEEPFKVSATSSESVLDALQENDSKVQSNTPKLPAPTSEAQILQLLTLLTKSARRLESELGLVKEEIKGVKEKLNSHGSDLDESSIDMALPTLPIRVKVQDSSVCDDPGSYPMTYTTATSPTNQSASSCKVQPRPSRFHHTTSVLNSPVEEAVRPPNKIRSSSLSIGDRRSSVIADLANLNEGGDAGVSTSPAHISKTPRRTSQRPLSRW